jgi:hypothetical protein
VGGVGVFVEEYVNGGVGLMSWRNEALGVRVGVHIAGGISVVKCGVEWCAS